MEMEYSRKPLTMKEKMPQYCAATAATLCSLLAGISFGWTSPVMNRLMGITGSHEPLEHPLTEVEASWVGSLLTLGAIVGPLFGGIFIDRFGRKYTLLVMAGVPAIIGWILTLSAKNAATLYAARFLIGMSTGSAATLAPIYVAEISSASERGTLCSLPQLMISLGVMLEYAVGPYVSYFALGGINLAASVIFITSFFFMPESPYFLIAIGKQEDAGKSLMWFRGRGIRNYSSSNTEVMKELEIISDAVEASGIRDFNLLDCFRNLFATRGNRKALLIMSGLLFTLQFCGINPVLFNAESILLGSNKDDPILGASESAIVIAVVQVASAWVATILADRLGRRPLLFFSTITAALSLGALGVHDYIEALNPSAVTNMAWLPVISLVMYLMAFNVGLGPLSWAVFGELFPSSSKSAAGILCGCFTWISGFIVTRTFQPIVSASGPYVAYWLYAACSFGGFIFLAVFLPETKCKTLEEIQRDFGVL